MALNFSCFFPFASSPLTFYFPGAFLKLVVSDAATRRRAICKQLQSASRASHPAGMPGARQFAFQLFSFQGHIHNDYCCSGI